MSFFASSKVDTSFKGTYLRIKPNDRFHLKNHKYGDHFVWDKPYTNVNNIIVGRVSLDHHGKVTVKNLTTEDTTEVNMKKSGWFSKEVDKVSAHITDLAGNLKFVVEGLWSEGLKI